MNSISLAKGLVSLATLFGVVFGAYHHLNSRHASAVDFKVLRERVDQKILTDQIMDLQRRKWQLEEHYGSDPAPPVKKEILELEEHIKCLEIELKKSRR